MPRTLSTYRLSFDEEKYLFEQDLTPLHRSDEHGVCSGEAGNKIPCILEHREVQVKQLIAVPSFAVCPVVGACGFFLPVPLFVINSFVVRADLQQRDPDTFKPLHIVSMTIRDSAEDSAAAAGDVLELCKMVNDWANAGLLLLLLVLRFSRHGWCSRDTLGGCSCTRGSCVVGALLRTSGSSCSSAFRESIASVTGKCREGVNGNDVDGRCGLQKSVQRALSSSTTMVCRLTLETGEWQLHYTHQQEQDGRFDHIFQIHTHTYTHTVHKYASRRHSTESMTDSRPQCVRTFHSHLFVE